MTCLLYTSPRTGNLSTRIFELFILDDIFSCASGKICLLYTSFRENYFADLALSGRFSSIAKNYTPKELRTATPELTNIGSYEKCWRQKSGHWIMVKSGTPEEHFSEIFTATLGKHLGFDMAEYALSGAYVVSRD